MLREGKPDEVVIILGSIFTPCFMKRLQIYYTCNWQLFCVSPDSEAPQKYCYALWSISYFVETEQSIRKLIFCSVTEQRIVSAELIRILLLAAWTLSLSWLVGPRKSRKNRRPVMS